MFYVLQILDLKENKLYQYQVAACNLAGVGTPSQPSKSFKCEEWTIAVPGNLFTFNIWYFKLYFLWNWINRYSGLENWFCSTQWLHSLLRLWKCYAFLLTALITRECAEVSLMDHATIKIAIAVFSFLMGWVNAGVRESIGWGEFWILS